MADMVQSTDHAGHQATSQQGSTVTRVVRREAQFSIFHAQLPILMGMALGLALFGWSGALAPALAGLLIFGVLALLRPDLGLLFVPLTAPLYLIPAAIAGLRADPSKPFMLPLYEAALLIVAAATLAGLGWRIARNQEPRTKNRSISIVLLRAYAPQLLFLAAGIWGLAIAIDRGPALIEFRRLIAEPLIFYVLLKFQKQLQLNSQGTTHSQLLLAFILGGALTGLLGLLQYIGLDLVPYLGAKQCFAPDGGVCSNIVADGGVRRVLSVYGHPNNLGLFLGRVWPLAAAIAISDFRFQISDFGSILQSKIVNPKSKMLRAWFSLAAALCCLGGILVSFSRGAWLGALAALAVLGLPVLRARLGGRAAPALVGLGVVLLALAGLGLSVRGDLTGGSTPVRLLLWREAIGYIRLHPLGIGLDQFVQYHDPNSGRSLIDPSLIGTSEQYAAHPHNLLLDTWLRLGPIGVAAFGWLLTRFFGADRGKFHDPLALGVLAAMTAALVHGLVDNFYFVPDLALAFWLLIALVEGSIGHIDDDDLYNS
jgi:putative inorganic carbon (hco3(-)) transporter